MSASRLKPTGWLYVLAISIPVFACLGTALLLFLTVPGLSGALEATGIHNLTQVVVPGSAEIRFPKAGAYAVYYEYRSVVDGVSYLGGERPPSMRCQLRSSETGEAVALTPGTVEGDVYTYPERAGVMFRRISIDQPGIYNFSCQYTDGRTNPRIVLALGPNIVREFLSGVAKPVAATLCGGLVFLLACGISMLMVGFVAFKRHQSKKTLDLQA